MFRSALPQVGLRCSITWVNDGVKRMRPRTFTLDAVPVRCFPLGTLLVPAFRSNIWMFQLLVIIAEDIF